MISEKGISSSKRKQAHGRTTGCEPTEQTNNKPTKQEDPTHQQNNKTNSKATQQANKQMNQANKQTKKTAKQQNFTNQHNSRKHTKARGEKHFGGSHLSGASSAAAAAGGLRVPPGPRHQRGRGARGALGGSLGRRGVGEGGTWDHWDTWTGRAWSTFTHGILGQSGSKFGTKSFAQGKCEMNEFPLWKCREWQRQGWNLADGPWFDLLLGLGVRAELREMRSWICASSLRLCLRHVIPRSFSFSCLYRPGV